MSKPKMPTIEIFKDDRGEFRFRIKARNGEIVAQSQGYIKRESCIKGINALADAMWQYEAENIAIKDTTI
jgi:uncharacterized protein YegP (UPF0339 family)